MVETCVTTTLVFVSCIIIVNSSQLFVVEMGFPVSDTEEAYCHDLKPTQY